MDGIAHNAIYQDYDLAARYTLNESKREAFMKVVNKRLSRFHERIMRLSIPQILGAWIDSIDGKHSPVYDLLSGKNDVTQDLRETMLYMVKVGGDA